jgi:hypothetical protein
MNSPPRKKSSIIRCRSISDRKECLNESPKCIWQDNMCHYGFDEELPYYQSSPYYNAVPRDLINSFIPQETISDLYPLFPYRLLHALEDKQYRYPDEVIYLFSKMKKYPKSDLENDIIELLIMNNDINELVVLAGEAKNLSIMDKMYDLGANVHMVLLKYQSYY